MNLSATQVCAMTRPLELGYPLHENSWRRPQAPTSSLDRSALICNSVNSFFLGEYSCQDRFDEVKAPSADTVKSLLHGETLTSEVFCLSNADQNILISSSLNRTSIHVCEGFGSPYHDLHQNTSPQQPLQGGRGAKFASDAHNFMELLSSARCDDSLSGIESRNSSEDCPNPKLNACHWSNSEGFGSAHHHLHPNPPPQQSLQGGCSVKFASDARNFRASPSSSRWDNSLYGNESKISLEDCPSPSLITCHLCDSEGFGSTHHHLHQNLTPQRPLQGEYGTKFTLNAHKFEESPSLSRHDDSLCGNESKDSLEDCPRLNACHCGDSEGLSDDRSSSSLNDGDIIVSRLRQCTKAKAHNEGRHLHVGLIINGFDHIRFFGNLLIEMFGQCRSLNDAHCVFARLSSPNLYSWTLLIKSYAENGDEEKALQLYSQMRRAGIQPDEIAFITILGVCGGLNALHEGWRTHAEIISCGFQMDTPIGNALIDMYGKCESPHNALLVCSRSVQRNVITWSALINVCVLNGLNKQALYCFKCMLDENITPDKIAFASILGACASYESQEKGRCIHANVVNTGFEKDVVIGNALVNMYGKCGVLDSARIVFDKMHHRNIITWTAIMMVYAQYGQSDEVLLLLSHMMAEGIQPDGITYVAVLTTCSHEGLLDTARSCLASMEERGVMFMLEYYVCLVDLLGRAGQLDVADRLLKDMPFACNAPALLSYISVCRMHGDVIRGSCAANAVLKLDPKNISSYTQLMYFCAVAEGHEA